MARLALSILFVVLFSTGVSADGLDSLINLTNSSDNKVRFRANLKLASKYRKTDKDSIEYFLFKAAMILKENEGKMNVDTFDFFNAQLHQHKALSYQSADIYDSAKIDYEYALKIYSRQNKNVERARVINNLGALQEQQGNYPEALKYYFKLMRLSDSLDLKMDKSRALINIGVIYNNQGNYDEALEYYNQAVPLKRELEDKKGEALLYNNIGIIYYYQDNYEKVLEYFKRSLNIYREIGDLRSQSMPYYNIAEIYYMQNAYKEALYYYKKSYEIDKELGERASQSETLSSIGRVYAEMGRMNDALRVQHEALKMLKKIGAKSRYSQALNAVAMTYELRGDYKNALKYFKAHKQMQDSVHTIKKESQIARIREQFESEKKDQEISFLQERNKRIEIENERQKQEIKNRQLISVLSLFIAVLVLLALVMIYRMYRQKKLSGQMLEIKNASITEKNQEISSIVKDLEKALKSREVLYANTTHELRTPLNIINGFTNLLQNEPDIDLRSKYVGQVKSSTNHLLRLIEDMLVISRIETGQFELVHEGVKLSDLAKYLTDIFTVMAQAKNINFSCTIDNSCPNIITVDPVRYFQILSNLIDNAIKYTELGGEIEVVFKYMDGRFLQTEVKDSGVGIATNQKEEIFERYNRLKDNDLSQSDGSGLGLNIVQQLVDLFEGRIELDSSVGKGSVFKVLIPSEVAFHITYRYAIVYDDVHSEKLETGRVLIAEDNIASAELMKQTIVVYNPRLKLDFVQNGEDALSQLRKHKYDLLILDIKMPGLTGIDVVEKLREQKDNQNRDIPVIGVSAQTDTETRKAANKAGINEFVSKPYEPAVLILKIEELAAIVKKREKFKKHSSEKLQKSNAEIKEMFAQVDGYLRDRNYELAIKLINDIISLHDLRINDKIQSILSDLEREIVTTRNDDKIGKLIANVQKLYQSTVDNSDQKPKE